MVAFAQSDYRREYPHAVHRALWLRVGLVLVCVVAAVLALISFLNYSNYRKTCLELNLTRNLVLAKDVREGVEAGFNVGLQPSEDLHLAPYLTDMARRNNGIRYLVVLDESGHPVGYGSLPAHSVGWQKRIAATAADSYWHSSDASTLEVGLPLVNNFSMKAGAVVIGYDRSKIERAIDDMLRELILDTLATLALLTGLILTGAYFLMRKLSADFMQVGAILGRALEAAEPAVITRGLLDEDLAKLINDFVAVSHRLVQEIDEAEQRIRFMIRVAPVLPKGGQ